MRERIVIAAAGCLAAAAAVAEMKQRFEVKADEFDPAHTHLVQGAWLEGIGCPTNAKTSGVSPEDRFTDPACPTGDPKDNKVEGLLLAKTGPTANIASAFARIDGVKGETVTELGWDIRKPATSVDTRGSHCGAGAPRWNIQTRDGRLFFIGCSSPPPTQERAGMGFVRMRWGGSVPLRAFDSSTGALVDISTLEVKTLAIVFDEGYDTGPDNFGMAILDNIDINGVLVGKGPTDAD
jgi:hypothetical protein